ncbi:ABC transporter permease [Chitinophaga oryziterrae]|uniref:Transport permease protein n=1 Tax=Chitinophaga oryziterrae TaxID=1031224 RepID=A0A6N8J4K8_9BACT|nr:ABC transporter permease [Chitinophaga oryziterrae]
MIDLQTQWKWKIEAKTRWFQWNLKELWQYKDLLNRFVRRDLIANYQQTVLGPFWIFLQPALTTLVYWLIFGKVARISTDGIPPVLFYLPGIIIWSYFSDCLNGTMYTFLQNSALFSKVYFPRLIIPLSAIVSHTIRMLVQLLLFTGIYLFYLIFTEAVKPNLYILLLPFLILLTAAFSLGTGLIISVMTARYRDLDYALQFVLRLFMFASPVVYPTSIVPEKYRFVFWLNPLTPIIESFRTAFFTTGPLHYKYLLLTLFSVTVILFTGLTLFKKKELNVMDII